MAILLWLYCYYYYDILIMMLSQCYCYNVIVMMLSRWMADVGFKAIGAIFKWSLMLIPICYITNAFPVPGVRIKCNSCICVFCCVFYFLIYRDGQFRPSLGI